MKTVASSSNIVRTSTAVSGTLARIRRVASIPSTPGIRTSMRTTSGRNSCTSRIAASPSAGVAHHLEPLDGREQGAQAAADDRMVIGDHQANGHVFMMGLNRRG